MIIGDVTEASLKEMDALIGEGVTSFKLFMAYPGVFYSDDGQIFRAMQKAADIGATVMMHAENGMVIDVLREQALQRGETDPRVPRPHPSGDHRGARRPTAPSPSPSWPAVRCTSSTWRPRRRWRRWPRPVTAGSTPSPRPVPSTSTSRSRSTCRCPGSREPSTCARRRSAAGPRATRTPCGAAWPPTTSRSCRPTTAPSASTTTPPWAPRSNSGWATSPRSPTGCPRWRTASS